MSHKHVGPLCDQCLQYQGLVYVNNPSVVNETMQALLTY